MIKAYRRSAGLAVLAASVLGVAACGGSSSPHVANLGASNGSNSGATTTTLPKGQPTQLLDEWAACERSHGNPNQVDPTIDANKVIHITFSPGAGANPGAGNSVGVASGGNGPPPLGKGSNDPCGVYLTAASTALRGGKPLPKPDPAKLEKFSQCMRANGIPDFPDPSAGGGLQLQSGPGSDLNPNNATFQKASKTCAKKAGVPGLGGGNPQPGSIEATAGSGPNGGPGGNGGAKSGVVIGG